MALSEIVAAAGARTTEGNLVFDVRTTPKIRETSCLTDPFTRGPFVAVRSKVPILTFTGGLRVAQDNASTPSRTIEIEFLAGILIAFVSPPDPLANALRIAVGNRHLASKVAGCTGAVLSAIGVGA